MRRFSAAVVPALIVACGVSVYAADQMLVVYPGKPGSAQAAVPTMKKLGGYIESHAGWGTGSLNVDYFNDEPAAVKALNGTSKPDYAILSLAVYLKWKKQGVAMTLLAQSELEKKVTMQFHLLVPEGSKITNLASAKGANIASDCLEDRTFATNVLFGGALDATKDVAIVDTKSMVSGALPACANFKAAKIGGEMGRIDAILLDDVEIAGMKLKPDFAKLHVAWSSAPLPTPPVVSFANANTGRAQTLVSVLTGMAGNASGRAVLGDISPTTAFREPNVAAYAAAEKLY